MARNWISNLAGRDDSDEGLKDSFWYVGPVVECKSCQNEIALPYGVLPQVDSDLLRTTLEENLLKWPDYEFGESIGCPRCGHLAEYREVDLRPEIFPQKTEAVYHDSAILFRVQFSCATPHCKAPATVYSNTSKGDAEERLLRQLERGFFSGLLDCGHEMGKVPRYTCKIERVTTRLW